MRVLLVNWQNMHGPFDKRKSMWAAAWTLPSHRTVNRPFNCGFVVNSLF
jgi:hypothetical protein